MVIYIAKLSAKHASTTVPAKPDVSKNKQQQVFISLLGWHDFILSLLKKHAR